MEQLGITPAPWTAMGDEIYGADGTRIAEAVQAKDMAALLAVPELIKTLMTLKRVAHIAHCGGLVGLTESEALTAVRRLTLSAWLSSGSNAELTERVREALKASHRKRMPCAIRRLPLHSTNG